MKIRKLTSAGAVLGVVVLVLSLALVPAAFAGKPSGGGGGGGKGGGGTTGGSTGTFSMVMVSDANGDGLPNWNDQITFSVSSNAAMPMVTVTCMQGSTQVDNQSVGFYAGWPWSQTFTLSHWYYWPTDSAADCTATLHYTGARGSDVTLSKMSFRVDA
jgi:hypothetical protein